MDIQRKDSLAAQLPIMGVVFAAFLVVGLAMPVLPLHVHHELGLGTFIVGLVAGSQFATSIVSRPWAGRDADGRGAKHAVIAGLFLAAAGGLFYLLSLPFASAPEVSVTILLLGRALLGAGESFIITGAQAWGLALAGPQNTGKIIAWMGTATSAAFALGAPAGASLYAGFGFTAIALATTLVPLACLLLVAPLSGIAPTARARPELGRIVAAVWLPGVGLALSAAGIGAVMAFVPLLFAARGWTVWPAFTVFTGAFIVARLFFGPLPDRIGGSKVALICALVEAAGLGLLWLAPGAAIALAGAALAGFGYSLVYPALGVEAVRRAPAEGRGLAMGAYTAFLDVALAVASPALGLIAAAASLGTVFLISALAALGAAVVAMRMLGISFNFRSKGPTGGTETQRIAALCQRAG